MSSSRKQVFVIFFLSIVVIGVVEGMRDAIRGGDWGGFIGQVVLLAIVAVIVWRSRTVFAQTRERYRRRFEETQDNLSVKDAALFSLAWSKEIYRGIPEDRKKLVKQAFLLIGIGMGIVWLRLGGEGITTLVIVAALVLAGVNLLVWVFSTERGERDRLRIELEAARLMQLSLMPTTVPEVAGYEIAGCCVPARDVGGDHFDYARMADGRFGIAVVDVAGKGMDAAMTAVFTSGAFVSDVLRETDLPRLMETLNTAIRSRSNRTRFVSLFLFALDAERGIAEYCNAGQTRPLLCRDGEVLELRNEGAHFPLGIVDDVAYTPARIALQKNDLLLFFTDGLSEAMNPAREAFGDERIAAAMRELGARGAAADECITELRARATAHAAGAEQHDDLTIVAVRVTGSSARN